MITKKLAMIGVGNMGAAIAMRLIQKEIIGPDNLFLVDNKFIDTQERSKIKDQISKIKIKNKKEVNISDDFREIIKEPDVFLLAIKPQIFPTLLPELRKFIKPQQLIISIAAGIPISNIKLLLDNNQPVVRVMPNLCAMVGESMSVWVKSKEVSNEQELITRDILQAIGKEVYLRDEDLIDAATAVSGSGPAYVFYLTELLESNAKELGFTNEAAKVLARQTVIGSAKFLAKSEKSAKELRLNVTSKGGTTEAAFAVFDKINLKSVFNKGIRAAWKKAKELSGK